MIRSTVLFALFSAFADAQSPKSLSDDELRILLLNTPVAIQTEARGGCPQVELTQPAKQQVLAQLRNRCPTEGTGMLDNYFVDRVTGKIWRGIDSPEYIDSERLRLVRRILLGATQQRK